MANHKSAVKRAKQNIIRQFRNKTTRTKIKNVLKKATAVLETKDKKAAEAILVEAQSTMSKGVSKGVIHKNTAARKISRLSKKVASL